ncbi:iron transporter FeoA [Megasphaera cerevisiae DSM 20462]|jgi:ferrous iron transport protein A|uniref:Iron transporter FeoA n=1 Tax=Megasphaera cerevisiae DSM 20462 TaxID=1122219 RepID=A0A0J6WVB6_9FIRM|nr:FeoA family protein [Megasphaera cerevisiae]KMO86143.1 iron transporter FeoA [Megasphaera cerevisiae DSM 20462]MCI1749981.1 ferrous iron transport protein A [Megasphaera cerevisiae]OKY54867.1 iron transporter FeoA [Megasphaera cerevisiae]SJZ39728.1 ferrous iron transport protein A [Megasphaera cerevisiae DSM 20462]
MNIVTLAKMEVGETGVVDALQGHGNIQHRLVDMGVVKGSHITVVKKAPLGDPVEVKVKGCSLALRMNEAAMINVAVEGGKQ